MSSTEKGMEFRSYADDAWYSVIVKEEGESIRVKYAEFPDDHDSLFTLHSFEDSASINAFAARFRPISVQLQDSHCSHATPGLLLCASHHFGSDDIRFYDALLDYVDRVEHSFVNGEEECLCSFVVSWLHGPNAGTFTVEKIGQVCRVQSIVELDPIVASLVIRARERFEVPLKTKSARSKKVKEVSNGPVKITAQLCFSHHIKQETNSIHWCLGDLGLGTPEWVFGYPSKRYGPEFDVGGAGSRYLIVIDNLEIDVTSREMMKFIRKEVSVLAQVFVFRSSSLEFFTRGNVVLDDKADFDKLSEFLENPNCFVVSSRGRPWVMTCKTPLDNTYKPSVLKNENEESSSGLMVVHLGSDQYEVAKQLSDLYKEYANHQKRLLKRLSLEEGNIKAKHKAKHVVKT